MKNLCMLYKNEKEIGKICKISGFYTDGETAQKVASNEGESFVKITPEIHRWIFESGITEVRFVPSEGVTNDTLISDTNDFVIVDPTPPQIDIDLVRAGLKTYIKSECGKFITYGGPVTLSSGEQKYFSFKLEDQINLKALVDNPTDNMIYYHARGEADGNYSYEDICTIYKTLYNNKLYNQIYTRVFCIWIDECYTEEMYYDPDIAVTYGFSNDYILEETERIYNEQKLL